MSRRIFLHVGVPKTGTTFLQRVLWAHAGLLAERGVLLPGGDIHAHFRACIDVAHDPAKAQHPELVPGAWRRLLDEMSAWTGDSLVSHELFSRASAEQATDALARIADAEVHVIVTARDLVRQLPAEWQEHLKHRSTFTLSEYVDQLRGPEEPAAFWAVPDAAEVVARWGASLPAAHVHVVTVPQEPAGPDVLWARFASTFGVDPAGFDLSKARANPSLNAEQAEVLRRLNEVLGRRLPLPGTYTDTVKGVLAHRFLAGRPGTPLRLVGRELDFAVARSRQIADRLVASGADLVGSLDDLLPPADAAAEPPGVTQNIDVELDAVLSEAIAALAEVLDRLGRRRAADPLRD